MHLEVSDLQALANIMGSTKDNMGVFRTVWHNFPFSHRHSFVCASYHLASG